MVTQSKRLAEHHRRVKSSLASRKRLSKKSLISPKVSPFTSAGLRSRAGVASSSTAVPLKLYLRLLSTPLGPFCVYLDTDGAVRCCHWQRCRDGDAAALLSEAREVCATMQKRWYKSCSVILQEEEEGGQGGLRKGGTTVELLTRYFKPSTAKAGSPVELEGLLSQVPIVCPPTTRYVAQTWATLRATVPAGETISYKALGVRVAKSLGVKTAAAATGAPRAVGAAMRVNPIPIIVPCHRVVSSTQSLGGYSDGLRRKVWLLRHEQASVEEAKLRAVEEEDGVCTAASLR